MKTYTYKEFLKRFLPKLYKELFVKEPDFPSLFTHTCPECGKNCSCDFDIMADERARNRCNHCERNY